MTAVEAALAGATVLTSSKRLARALTRFVQQAERDRGQPVWRTRPILPLDAFVRKCFDDWLYSARATNFPVSLNILQQEAVWEQIILESDGDRLLQPHATAAAARDAWDLAMAWRVPVSRANFAASEDCEAFFNWALRYRDRCRAEGWLDSARLMDVVRERIAADEIVLPKRLGIAGFDELTPQQAEFIHTLRGSEQGSAAQLGLFSASARSVDECAGPSFAASPVLRTMRDASHELSAAAEWARSILVRNPRARIGVIVPRLASVRAQADRIFGDVLHPGAFPDADRAWHISAGRSLADYPVVRAALLLIEACRSRTAVSAAGLLLRCPFIAGADAERDARAVADLSLRRRPSAEISPGELLNYTDACPTLAASLRAANEQVAILPPRQSLAQWSRTFASLPAAFGWPGDRALSSHEFQTIQTWHGALSALASLESIVAAADFDDAVRRLRGIASKTIFQPENEGAPVEILGMLEASGLTFDHLWITGLDDETVPGPARPNPFLPLGLQLRRGMPHSSARRESEFARFTLRRLIASAPDVTLSYARASGERQLNASPLLAEIGAREAPAPETALPLRRWFGTAPLEDLFDESGPPLASTVVQRGGASLLKAMAECPFKAFASFRLNAGELNEAEFGLSAADRGKAVHKAMELVWRELESQAALKAATPAALDEVVRRAISAAVPGGGAMQAIERDRLRHLILRWLGEVESVRRPFIVEACESKETVPIGNLKLEVRVDRIDKLADGRLAIVDYKTGQIGGGCWDGARPAEPQLPLYAATCRQPLGAVLIAQIRREEPGFLGLSDGEPLPMKQMRCSADSLAAQRDEWTRVLTALAEGFRQGFASVDPAKHACDFCRFTALCRIHDEGELATENRNGDE